MLNNRYETFVIIFTEIKHVTEWYDVQDIKQFISTL